MSSSSKTSGGADGNPRQLSPYQRTHTHTRTVALSSQSHAKFPCVFCSFIPLKSHIYVSKTLIHQTFTQMQTGKSSKHIICSSLPHNVPFLALNQPINFHTYTLRSSVKLFLSFVVLSLVLSRLNYSTILRSYHSFTLEQTIALSIVLSYS